MILFNRNVIRQHLTFLLRRTIELTWRRRGRRLRNARLSMSTSRDGFDGPLTSRDGTDGPLTSRDVNIASDVGVPSAVVRQPLGLLRFVGEGWDVSFVAGCQNSSIECPVFVPHAVRIGAASGLDWRHNRMTRSELSRYNVRLHTRRMRTAVSCVWYEKRKTSFENM